MELGFYDKTTLDKNLLEQTALKAEAAVIDIQTIINSGSQTAPAWLVANWGNNGINPAATNPSIADGVSAASNIAQNIVMIANDRPTIAKEVQPAVVAAAYLARGILSGASTTVPIDKKANEWVETMTSGLTLAVLKTGYIPKDRNKTEININDFITERTKEVKAGVNLSLSKEIHEQMSPSR